MSDNNENQNFSAQNIEMESGEPTGENAKFKLGSHELELEGPKLKDVGHPLVPDIKKGYIAREINGVVDLKLLSYVVNDPDFFAILEGEAAVGKNHSIDTYFGLSNWPRVRVNFGLGTTYENLVGRYAPADTGSTEEETVERSEAVKRTAQRLFTANEHMEFQKALELSAQSIPEGSSFEWIDGLLTKAVKYGWGFVADEINAAEDEAIMPLNGLLEDRDSRYLTIEEKSEIIEPHPRFRFVATRNPISYAGVSDMNSALESRGYIIEYDYHEPEALKEILKDRTDIVENESEGALNSLVSLADDIRRQEQSGTDIMTKISTRDLIKTGRLTDIMDIRDATKTVFLGVADPTDEQSIRELVETQSFQ